VSKYDETPGAGAGLNILVWRNGKLGNTVVAIPFLLALRKTLPGCRITVVAESLGAELLTYYTEINEIIVYNKRREHKGFLANIRFVMRLRSRRYTHSFHLKRFFRNAFLSFLAGIPERLGFAGGSGERFLTRTLPYREDQNIVKTNLSLIALLGATLPENQQYRFHSSEQDKNAAGDFLARNKLLEKGFVVIHCGGDTVKEDKIPAELFREIASRVHTELMLVPVFISAPGDEKAVAEVVNGLEGKVPCVIFDDRRIRVNAAVIQNAALFIGSNSGQAHLAALVATPTVVLYKDNGQAEFFIRKWLPWQEKAECVIIEPGCPAKKVASEVLAKAALFTVK